MQKFLSFALALLLGACAGGASTELKAGQRYATVYTAAHRKSEGLFPVVIYSIDGQKKTGDRNLYQLPPGRHTIEAWGIVDLDWVSTMSRDLSRENTAPLVFNFQSGTRYYIGLKASASRREDWQLVIWKQEEVDEGVLGFD